MSPALLVERIVRRLPAPSHKRKHRARIAGEVRETFAQVGRAVWSYRRKVKFKKPTVLYFASHDSLANWVRKLVSLAPRGWVEQLHRPAPQTHCPAKRHDVPLHPPADGRRANAPGRVSDGRRRDHSA